MQRTNGFQLKFYRSLASRVATVFLLLVIFPLLLYVAFLWSREWKVTLTGVFSEMELIGDFAGIYLEKWYKDGLLQLDILTFQDKEKDALLSKGFSTILKCNRNFECIYSNRPSLVGKKDLFQGLLKKAYDFNSLMFIAINPATQRKELFLFKRKGEALVGLSVALEDWIAPFTSLKGIGYPAILSFIVAKEVVFSTGAENRDRAIRTWDIAEIKKWQKKAGIWEWAALKGKDLALNFNVPNANFDLFVSISSDQIQQYGNRGFFAHLLTLIGILVLIGGAGAFWLILLISRPLQQLYTVMDNVRTGNYNKKYIPDRFGFEINILGENFNQMLKELLQNMQKAENERVEREILSQELRIGRSVQKGLLPKEIPEFSSLSLGVGFSPAKDVAGDFYDLFARDDKELLIAIADASDKGVSACFYSLVVRSMLRSHAIAGESLQDIIMKTNELFCKDTALTGNFVTAWVALYETETNTMHYHSAGHMPAIVVLPDGSIEEHSTPGIALGVDANSKIEVRSLHLPKGSLLFLYSDGVTEAHNEKGELFGKSRLLDFLRSHHQLDPQKLIDALIEQVHQFAGELSQHDDLTAVSISVL